MFEKLNWGWISKILEHKVVVLLIAFAFISGVEFNEIQEDVSKRRANTANIEQLQSTLVSLNNKVQRLEEGQSLILCRLNDTSMEECEWEVRRDKDPFTVPPLQDPEDLEPATTIKLQPKDR